MSKSPNKIIIEGVNTDTGQDFRPSNWAERMSDQLSFVKRHRIHYSPLLQPATQNGHRCVVLDPSLADTNPTLYHSILAFAETNHLKICKADESD